MFYELETFNFLYFKHTFRGVAILYLAPPIAIYFIPCYVFSLVTSNDVKNKHINSLEIIVLSQKDKGGKWFVFSSLQIPEMFIKLRTPK